MSSKPRDPSYSDYVVLGMLLARPSLITPSVLSVLPFDWANAISNGPSAIEGKFNPLMAHRGDGICNRIFLKCVDKHKDWVVETAQRTSGMMFSGSDNRIKYLIEQLSQALEAPDAILPSEATEE